MPNLDQNPDQDQELFTHTPDGFNTDEAFGQGRMPAGMQAFDPDAFGQGRMLPDARAVDTMHDTAEIPAVADTAPYSHELDDPFALPEPAVWIGQNTINPGDSFDSSAARSIIEMERDNDRQTARQIGKWIVAGTATVALGVGAGMYITSGEHSSEPQAGHIIEQTEAPVPPSPSIVFEMPAPAETQSEAAAPRPEAPAHQPTAHEEPEEPAHEEPLETEEPERPDDGDTKLETPVQVEPIDPQDDVTGEFGNGHDDQQREQDGQKTEKPGDREHEDDQDQGKQGQDEKKSGQSDAEPADGGRVNTGE